MLGKCPGPDGIHTEALHYGGKRLCTLLCILFNMCMKIGYMPSQLTITRPITLNVQCQNRRIVIVIVKCYSSADEM